MAYRAEDEFDTSNAPNQNSGDKNTFYLVDWLDDCYQQLAIPNLLTQKLIDKLSNGLAPRLKSHLDHSSKQQALFMLLGKQYVKQHFSSYKFDLSLLDPPHMAADAKVALLDDTRTWLLQQLFATSHDLGYDRATETGSAPSELGEFQEQLKSVFESALSQRVEQLKSKPNKRSKPKLLSTLESSSDALGEALLAVGIKDSFEMAHILKTLQKNCFPLPSRLRSYVWQEFLFLRQGVKTNILLTTVVEEKRSYFKTTAERNASEFKQISPFESHLNQQISDTVMEVYDHNFALRTVDSDAHLLEAVRVLNALYSYNQIFNPLYVYWLCPLQFALAQGELENDEWLHHLAFQLEFFIPECPLSHAELFSTAEQVLDTLKNLDPFLHENLFDVTSKRVIANPKDFPEECYHLNRSEAKNILSELENYSGKEISSAVAASVVGSPAIFLRKWLATGFVSVLSQPALLLFWDIIFLSKWDRRRLQDLCLIILGLLKTWFYTAQDYSGIRRVFFEEGSRLFTSDLRRAWTHWQNQGSFDAIPDMNRNCQNINNADGGGKRLKTK